MGINSNRERETQSLIMMLKHTKKQLIKIFKKKKMNYISFLNIKKKKTKKLINLIKNNFEMHHLFSIL